jgi:uncharacterized RDD family membrane protein YckC
VAGLEDVPARGAQVRVAPGSGLGENLSAWVGGAGPRVAVDSVWLRRIVARLVDITAVAVCAIVPILASDPFKSRGLGEGGLGCGLGIFAWAAFSFLVLWPAYEILGANRGATPGKKLMGLRVLSRDGALPTKAQAVRRAGLTIFQTEIVLLFGSGFTFAEHNPLAGAVIAVAVVAPSLTPILLGRMTWVDRVTHTTVARASLPPHDQADVQTVPAQS